MFLMFEYKGITIFRQNNIKDIQKYANIIQKYCIIKIFVISLHYKINERGMTLEITALNGTRYQFVEVEIFTKFVNIYAWYSNKWNRLTRTFKTMDEARAWIAELDADYVAWKNAPKVSYELPEGAYYSLTGYYGD